MTAKKTTKTDKKSQIAGKDSKDKTIEFEKRIYDLEQLLDIAKSFCQNLEINNLLESIVYICMAQMHTLGAEIFVRDLLTNDFFYLETSKDTNREITLPVNCDITNKLAEVQMPITLDELKKLAKNSKYISVLESLSPTLIVPLVSDTHMNGILVLQERIALDEDTSYTNYEKQQIMMIASLASVAISNAALLEKSSIDSMTHLKLKYYFFNKLSSAIDKAILTKEPISVLMFDIDHFKIFNDTYGHDCGDFVLIGVADIIKNNMRDSDIASRYGGEEFTVLLNMPTGRDSAMLVAERIRAAIESHDFIYNGNHLHVTISIGVSTFDLERNFVESPVEFVKQADKALYISKESGRNKVSFYEPVEDLEDIDE